MNVRRTGARGWVSAKEINEEGWSYPGCGSLRQVKSVGTSSLPEIAQITTQEMTRCILCN